MMTWFSPSSEGNLARYLFRPYLSEAQLNLVNSNEINLKLLFVFSTIGSPWPGYTIPIVFGIDL